MSHAQMINGFQGRLAGYVRLQQILSGIVRIGIEPKNLA
jgi:hypothetical protein